MGNVLCPRSAYWDTFLRAESTDFRYRFIVSNDNPESEKQTIGVGSNKDDARSEKDSDAKQRRQRHVGRRCSVPEMRDLVELMKLLGSGSFGSVYLIRNRQTRQLFALKSMRKDKLVKMKQVQHVEYERNVLSTIRMVFIMELICTFQDATHIHLMLEYITGPDLFELLRQHRTFPESTVQFYTAQVFMALEYLHSLHILYRDLKPENLVLNCNGYLKLVDFSFAKFVPKRTYTMCGTPDYMAPETIMHRGYGTSVDWWAFGVLIFELLYGHTPFQSRQILELYEEIVAGFLKYPKKTEMSDQGKNLIGCLIEVDVTKRYGVLRRRSLDIREHAWFSSTNWDSLFQRSVRPPILIPKPKVETDYVLMPEQVNMPDPYADQFTDF